MRVSMKYRDDDCFVIDLLTTGELRGSVKCPDANQGENTIHVFHGPYVTVCLNGNVFVQNLEHIPKTPQEEAYREALRLMQLGCRSEYGDWLTKCCSKG